MTAITGTRYGSLRAKIIAWSFVPTAIILAAVSLLNYYSYQNVTRDLVLERDRDLTRLSASQLSADLGQYAAVLTAVARQRELLDGEPALVQAALQEAANRLVIFDGGVVALDTFGKVLASQPPRADILGRDWSSSPYFRQLLRSVAPVYSDIVTDGPGSAQVIVVAVPITGFRGELLGVLLGMFRVGDSAVSAFYGGIVKLRVGESGSAYLVDSRGRVIYHSQSEHIGGDLSTQPVVRAALEGRVGALRTQDLDNRDVVATYAPVAGTTWSLVAEETWEALMGPSESYRRFLLILVALGVVVPALVVTAGVGRITQPILDLIAAAQQVASGNLKQRISVHTDDELEELAEQFNRMSAQLQASYAGLERRVADRTRELQALNAVAAVVSRSLDLEEILEAALDKTMQVMHMDLGAAYCLDSEGGQLALVAHRGLSPEILAALGAGPIQGGGAQELVQAQQEGRDMGASPPLVRRLADYPPSEAKHLISQENIQQVVTVPLVAKGKLLGALALAARAWRDLTPEELALLSGVGQQAGVALENARLYERAEQVAAAAERSRLARELHDAVTQTLFSASLMAEVLPRLWERNPQEGRRRLEELRQLTRGALAEMRTLLLELRPTALLDANLCDLLRQLTEAYSGRARLPIALAVTGAGECTALVEVKVALYRIAQEALNNIIKHAQATQVQVTLRVQPDQVELRISDDGRGFDPAAVPPDHLGLGIMRERATGIGATLTVESEPEGGTEVIVHWVHRREI